MTIRLFSGFSTDDIGNIKGTAKKSSGSALESWVMSGSFFVPWSGSNGFISGGIEYNGAVDKLQTSLIGALTTVDFDVRYDNNLNRVVLSASTIINSLTFNSASQKTFGFDSSYSNAKVITGSVAPWFIWTSSQAFRANDSFEYEKESYFNQRISDSGRIYSIGRRTPGKYRDWDFVLEPKSNIFTVFSSSAEPYGMERFIKGLREGPTPFVLFDGVTLETTEYNHREALYEMRKDGIVFAPTPSGDQDQHEYWDIKFKTRAFFQTYLDKNLQEISGTSTPLSPPAPAPDWIMATGGTVVTASISGSNYAIHKFLTTGADTFSVSRVGTTQNTVDYLLVAGGGAGAWGLGAGGGAGGMITSSSVVVTVQNYPTAVGAGGVGVAAVATGAPGANSSIFSITAIGGGGGGMNASTLPGIGGSGGGGGGGTSGGTIAGAAGTAGQGYAGGSGTGAATTINRASGGGGGANGVGGNTTTGVAGDGGPGKYSGITGTDTAYAGGGGGNTGSTNIIGAGTGGIGGGGDGAYFSSTNIQQSGGANTGGGGGGSWENAAPAGSAGSGGSGIIIIRYKIL